MHEAAASGIVPDVGPPNTKEQEAALRPMCAQLKVSRLLLWSHKMIFVYGILTPFFIVGGPGSPASEPDDKNSQN